MDNPSRRCSPIEAFLEFLHAKYAPLAEGEVATYIPELASADPEAFGICVATTDGFVYEVGASRQEFTIQSISKPFVYGLALDDNGPDWMMAKVGVEPSGDAFNAISLHKVTGCPLNPMINAGAIATTGQIAADTPQQRLERMLQMFGLYAGRPLRIDQAVYLSESRTGHRNRAIGHLLRNFDVLTDEPDATVDTYFQQCAIAVTCGDLALMGATLANQGINPLTGARAIQEEHVENVLSVMASCGMYDFSGGWIYNVGMPAKSGVAGGVLAVLPGQLGIGVFSPRLDPQGNSVRALKVCEDLSRAWELHQFNPPYCPQNSRRLTYTSAQRTSSRTRHPAEREHLRATGHLIHVVEMQSNLAFSTTEPIVREVMGSAEKPQGMILDCHHVTSINRISAHLLADLARDLKSRGCVVYFTHTSRLPMLKTQVASHLADSDLCAELFHYHSTDAALEQCEDLLLGEARAQHAGGKNLRDFEITAGLTADELAVFASLLTDRYYANDKVIIRRGTESTNLCLITKGVVGVWLGGVTGEGRRMGSFSVGTMVGEMAFLDGEKRSANVVAEGDVECAVLEIAAFLALQQSHPALHTKILRNIGISLATKLRKLNQDVTILSAQRD